MSLPVLMVVDVQKAIDHPSWGARNNPAMESNLAMLLAHWRGRGGPVWHVRHDSQEPDSFYRPGQAYHDFKPEAKPLDGEPVIPKRTNSAFIGTDLEEQLHCAGHESLVITGVITNNSVEATVRTAGNLGFETYLVEDACFTVAKRDWSGILRSADDVHAMALANMDGEYCQVIRTSQALERWA